MSGPQVDLRMNGYLFGCLLLLVAWGIVWIALRLSPRREQIPEFWWASFACAALGFTEPLFVPEYWEPPSVLSYRGWDLESFLFCFAVGGISAVLTELPPIKSRLVSLYYSFERLARWGLSILSRLTGGRLHARFLDQPSASRLVPPDQVRIENMLLVTFFVGMFGATTNLGLNIIYDAAIVCVATALMIAWRRPSLRWQILGGGISFLLLYTMVLVVMGFLYEDFYDHWNQDALSGIEILGAPSEEYMFAFTFGVFWAPLYEAWKQSR